MCQHWQRNQEFCKYHGTISENYIKYNGKISFNKGEIRISNTIKTRNHCKLKLLHKNTSVVI